jgi:site-specific DNA recombinase
MGHKQEAKLGKLDGRVDGAFFDKMSAQWRDEQNRCLREVERYEFAEQSYMDEGVQILELARNAQKLFEWQEPREKRRLLNFVLSNCTWEDGEVVATFRQPFDLLAETTAIAMRSAADDKGNLAKSGIWLPFLDTYRTMCRAPGPAFRRILEDIRELRFAA